ncbi:hypothetical protein Golob_007631, partial [Gossypium lobatum]|nr:hypothetical protein [Gossypium lobatum]
MIKDEITILEEKLVQLLVKSFVSGPDWKSFKIGPYPPECDKKNLMHAIASTFGGDMIGNTRRFLS